MAVEPKQEKRQQALRGAGGGNDRGDEGERRPLPSHRIRDLKSFNEVTGDSRKIAGLYFYCALDPVIELALDVSRDFYKRPQIFIEVGDPPVAPLLAKLGARVGSTEEIPSKEQRNAIFTPLFGEAGAGGDTGDFPRLRSELVQAAAAFAERSFDTGVGMLRERVREANRSLNEYLTGLAGASISWSRDEALATITEEIAYPILRSQAVSAVYGIPTPPRKTWPYTEDSNGDKLVEEIAKESMMTNGRVGVLTREGFTNLQRAALRGAEALATVIDFDEGGEDDEVDLLITKVYTWGSALGQTDFPFLPVPAQSLYAPTTTPS
jgi:hypothetical protein